MKRLFLALLLVVGARTAALAQADSTYHAPAGYSFRDASDYASYAPQVVEAVNWLEQPTAAQHPDTKRAVNQFLMQWVSGSPAVKVKMQTFVTEFGRNNPDYIMLFLGAWARHQILNPAEKSNLALNLAGLTPVLKVYQANPVHKNKVLDELLQEQANGTLTAWVQKRVLP